MARGTVTPNMIEPEERRRRNQSAGLGSSRGNSAAPSLREVNSTLPSASTTA
jgi:hypothetical protein